MARRASVRYWPTRKAYGCWFHGRGVVLAEGPDDAPQGPTAAATAADFDPQIGAIIYHSDDNRLAGEFRHKTAGHGKDRIIFLVGEALAVVKELAAKYRKGPLFRINAPRCGNHSGATIEVVRGGDRPTIHPNPWGRGVAQQYSAGKKRAGVRRLMVGVPSFVRKGLAPSWHPDPTPAIPPTRRTNSSDTVVPSEVPGAGGVPGVGKRTFLSLCKTRS